MHGQRNTFLNHKLAAEPQAMAELSQHAQRSLAKGLKTLTTTKHAASANNFAVNVNEGTPVVLVNIHSSDKHGGGHLVVDRCNCLTAGLCKTGGPWIVNLCKRMVLREIETLPGIPPGRLTLPAGIAQSKYAAMIGNAFTAGVIGRVALQLLKLVGKLPSIYLGYSVEQAMRL